MREPIFKGAATAIITPFTESGTNYEKLEELLEFQIANKIDAIVVCGTTGEASTMPDKEHIAAVKFAVEKTKGRVPIIAGAGSNDTKHAVDLSKSLEDVGADALLSVTPYYNKTTQKGLVTHFDIIAKSVKLPIIIYNVPSRTNLNVAPDTFASLSKIENIVGVKECNLDQVGETILKCEKDFTIYTGEDGCVLPLLAWGGKGVISVMSNIIPKDTHDLCQKFFDGDLEGARNIQLKAVPLIKALFCEVNPIPVKEAMNMMGMDVGECRLPLVGMMDSNKKFLREALEAYGLLDKA